MNYEIDVKSHKEAITAELEHLYQTAPVGLCLLDNHLRFIRVNEHLANINGMPKNDHFGKTLHEVIPELADRVFELCKRCRDTGEALLDQHVTGITAANPDHKRDWLCQYFPIKNGEGTVIGVSAAIQDVTSRTKAENKLQAYSEKLEKRVSIRTEQLTKANDKLRKSNRELKDFAFVVSHDLQEPLRTLYSYCELLDNKCADSLDEKVHKYVRYIIDGSIRMKKFVADLLEFSGSIAEKESELTSSKMAFICAMNNLIYKINITGAEITNGHLPLVMCDETQLIQVFQNLIGNALKFKNDRPLKIHVDCEEHGNTCTFSIRDNGKGIEKKYLDHIFVVFRRIDKYPNAGSGVGLTICKKIIEQHKGEVWVESTPDVGTTFFFSLSLADQ